MARSQDILPSQQGWIHELAQSEIHPDAEKLLQLGKTFDPQQLVEESTIDFLAELRECFSEYSRIFNAYSETGARFQEIKVYSVAQTAADFMLFRNQIKLIFSNSAHGVIQISFAHHLRTQLSIDGQDQVHKPQGKLGSSLGESESVDLLAQMGPFHDVFWTFRGEKITPEQIAKFYFAEFSKITRNFSQVSRSGNQLLLNQIKTLLQQKGFDL